MNLAGKVRKLAGAFAAAMLLACLPGVASQAMAQKKKPNIIFIMGDDIGWSNIGVYNQGIIGGPHAESRQARQGRHAVHRLLRRGELHRGTGELHHRRTADPHGSDDGRPGGRAARDARRGTTIATMLKSMGYATGQFGKNHLGDRNQYLPTVHGFDEFFGYLYHLDAMEDPCHRNYPQALKDKVGPRNMIHSWATDSDDSTVQPRWGKIGMQKIEDAGQLCPERMKTVDDEILERRSSSPTRQERTASHFSCGSTRPGCTWSRICRTSTKICASRKTAGASRRPGWRSSTNRRRGDEVREGQRPG